MGCEYNIHVKPNHITEWSSWGVDVNSWWQNFKQNSLSEQILGLLACLATQGSKQRNPYPWLLQLALNTKGRKKQVSIHFGKKKYSTNTKRKC